MQTGAAPVENTMEVLHRVRNTTAMRPSDSMSGYKRMKAGEQRGMLPDAFFTTVKTWKQPELPSMDGQMKKTWSIHTMEDDSALIQKEILTFVPTWVDLEDVMLRMRIQTEEDRYHVISLRCAI